MNQNPLKGALRAPPLPEKQCTVYQEKAVFCLKACSAYVLNAEVAVGEKEWITVEYQARRLVLTALDILAVCATARVDEDYATEEVTQNDSVRSGV